MNKLDTKLVDIDFGRNNCRIQNYFISANLITVGDVVNYPIEDLVKIKGFGQIVYWDIMGTFADEDIYHAKLWVETTKSINKNIKIEIKKSEFDVIKQALRLYSTLIKENKYVGHDYWEGEHELYIEDDKLSLPYKISLLKKLAEIEYRIVEKQVDCGFLKKIIGLDCWWKWTTTDKNWKKTIFAKTRLKQRIG